MTPDELALFATLKIASPCPVRWKDMQGGEKRRMCGQCQRHVYRIAALTTAETLELVRATRGQFCAQLFRRTDGTVMTKDCPSVWSVSLSQATARFGPAAGASMVVVVGVALFLAAVSLFGDNIRALLGQSSGGALAGDVTVTRRSQP